ncbi:MAG TPA: hypothetical protein VNQ90_05575 [Chthoniobacteraceae bacterium]|nr:hypothetical protein [Chthoniobacteraceae bacterium]
MTSVSDLSLILSHPPTRLPVFSRSPDFPEGPFYCVDPLNGDDRASGTEAAPWKSINASLEKLRPGDTLLLREGIYFEAVYCSIVGKPGLPITLRSYPGERAILDGSLPEFQVDPAGAWEPAQGKGEYRSTREYRNIRDVLGLFADSHLGLQTYWHRDHLLAENELAGINPATGSEEPYYCGPGLFYDKTTGRIHARLAPTRQNSPFFDDYNGPADPRELPLVVTPFRRSPLFLDQAMHLRFRDLIVRGGGYNTLLMHFAVDVEFEYVTVYGGTYCIRSKNSGPVKLRHCGVYGQIPPWGYRTENCLMTFDHLYYDPFTQPPTPRSEKNIARLPTHAVLVMEGGEESDVFYFPANHHWEVSHCEFADSHDGLYFNGRHLHLHHCWMHDMQDDVIYLSNPTPTRVCDDVHISRNYLSHCMLPFGGHTRGCSSGQLHIYGNVVDMREPTRFDRPTFEQPEGRMQFPNRIGSFFLIHGLTGLLGMENLGFYHNTVLITSHYAGSTLSWLFPETTRSVYNNIFVYYRGWPELEKIPATKGPIRLDGNLHWSPVANGETSWLDAVRASPQAAAHAACWNGETWDRHSLEGNPCFYRFSRDTSDFDGRLQEGSPARGLAVDFPQRALLHGGAAGPHAGAYQNDEPLRVGIDGRVEAGFPL